MKVHGRQTRVYFNGWDLSDYFNSADSSGQTDMAEVTGFGAADKAFIPGMRSGTIKLGGFYDNTVTNGVESLLESVQAGTDGILSVITTPNINEGGVSSQVQETSLSKTSPVGGVVTMSADFTADALAVQQVRTVFPKGNISSAAAGGTTSVYNGGTATAKGAIAWMQAFEVNGGTPVVLVEHSANGSAGWSTLATFAAMPLAASAPQAQVVSVSGTVQPYKRVTVTGGSANIWVGLTQPIA